MNTPSSYAKLSFLKSPKKRNSSKSEPEPETSPKLETSASSPPKPVIQDEAPKTPERNGKIKNETNLFPLTMIMFFNLLYYLESSGSNMS